VGEAGWGIYGMGGGEGGEGGGSWSGFSQHSYDCLPLRTDHLPAREVLRFRDDAFHAYFANPKYLEMVEGRFGTVTRRHVAEMSSHRLARRLLEDTVPLSAA